MSRLFAMPTITILFLGIRYIPLFASLIYYETSFHMQLLRIISACFYSIVGYLSFKKQGMFIVVFGVIVLLSGIGNIAIGGIIFRQDRVWALIFLFAGAYFTAGGAKLVLKK